MCLLRACLLQPDHFKSPSYVPVRNAVYTYTVVVKMDNYCQLLSCICQAII